MRRRRFSRGWVVLAVGAAALIVVSLAAARVQNGSFEKGFKGWATNSHGDGQWSQNYGTGDPPLFDTPPKGNKAAFSTQDDPTSAILYQDVKLRKGNDYTLSFWLAYQNEAPDFVTPDNLSEEDDGTNPNQQFRMDVMRPSAPLREISEHTVLRGVYITEQGDALTKEWTKVTVPLDGLDGRKVRLRFAEVDNQAKFTVGIDGVKVKSS